MSNEPIIRLKDIRKSYGTGASRTEVLRGVSLDVMTGDFFALVGQSGSGKSTLLNIIGGLDTKDSGSVEVMGVDYDKASGTELARMRNQEIGFVFQSFNLLDHLTVLENVLLPANFGRMENPTKLALEALERVGLAEFSGRKPTALSGGQKQRVAIARALFARPKLLLCDEPTGNLDSQTGTEVIEFFQELNREHNITLIIVTHELRVSDISNKVIGIRDGQLLDEEESTAVEAGPA